MSQHLVNSSGAFECFVCGVPREIMFDVDASSDTFKVCWKCVDKYGKDALAHEGDRLLGEGFRTQHNRVPCRFGGCRVQMVEDDKGTAPIYCREHMKRFIQTVEPYLKISGNVQGVEEK